MRTAAQRSPARPLDPDSPKGREVAARLTRTLAAIELEIADRKRRAAAAAAAASGQVVEAVGRR